MDFPIYNQGRELLTERGRKQPELSLPKVPSDVKELEDILKAIRIDKKGEIFFDCGGSDQHIAALLDNRGA